MQEQQDTALLFFLAIIAALRFFPERLGQPLRWRSEPVSITDI